MTVGLVEVMDIVKSSSPSAILSSMVAIMAFIAPSETVPAVNVTMNGVGTVKSAAAVKIHNNNK